MMCWIKFADQEANVELVFTIKNTRVMQIKTLNLRSESTQSL